MIHFMILFKPMSKFCMFNNAPILWLYVPPPQSLLSGLEWRNHVEECILKVFGDKDIIFIEEVSQNMYCISSVLECVKIEISKIIPIYSYSVTLSDT